MIFSVLFAAVQMGQPPLDPAKLLQQTFDQRANADVSIGVSINREEQVPGGKSKRTRLELSYCRFADKEFCALSRDAAGEKYSYKLCKGCYQPDKDRVLISTSGATDDLVAKSSKEVAKSKMVFDLRLLGFYSFDPEGIGSTYTRTYLLDIYERPKLDTTQSTGDVTCVELASKSKTGSLRYFINTKLHRLEKVTMNDAEFDGDFVIQSEYAKESDFFPAKVSKTTRHRQHRLTEEVVVTEARRITRPDEFNWTPDLVNFRKNSLVAGSKLSQNKPVQTSLFYDGSVLREPTKKDFEDHGNKIEPSDSLSDDNARRQGSTPLVYLVPVAFFGVAVLFLTRYLRSKAKSRDPNVS